MMRLTQRRDFLAAAQGLSQAMPGVIVQMRKRDDDGTPRVGFTCTKKIGNAVVRNRIRRRMKEAVRMVMPAAALSGHDYVLIGRVATENRDFEDLGKDIISALTRLHAGHGSGYHRAKQRGTPRTS
jgi:ribonuclease P protein component